MAVECFSGDADRRQMLQNCRSHGSLDEAEKVVRSAIALNGSRTRRSQVETSSLRIVKLALFQRIPDSDDDTSACKVRGGGTTPCYLGCGQEEGVDERFADAQVGAHAIDIAEQGDILLDEEGFAFGVDFFEMVDDAVGFLLSSGGR